MVAQGVPAWRTAHRRRRPRRHTLTAAVLADLADFTAADLAAAVYATLADLAADPLPSPTLPPPPSRHHRSRPMGL